MTASPAASPADVARTVEEAYLYAYPLVLLDVIKDMATNTIEATEERAPVNQLFHARSLATPDMVSLTRPNVDTLYSQAYLDLAAEPVLLFKPRTERYCTVQTFDGHSNTPFILGTDGLGGNDEAVYALCGPFWDGALPDGVQAVRMPTDFAWLLLRTKCFGPDDVENVHAVQDAMDTCPLSAFDDKRAGTYRPAPGAYDPARDYVPLEYMANLSLQDYFDRFNRLAQDNPGAAADAPALARFAELGIGAGLAFDLQALGEDVVRATAHLPHLIDRAYSSEHAHITPSNGWMFMDERVGRFGTDYAFRTVVAYGGFANPVSMAVYPSMVMDEEGVPLRGDRAYALHFEPNMTPPHGADGWWSLTAYTDAGRLVENELGRYNLGEVDDLPFNEDGSLDLFIQATNPGGRRERAWIPVCEGVFSLTMRIYLPTADVLSFAWQMPRLRVRS